MTYDVATLTADKAIGSSWVDGVSVSSATRGGAVEVRMTAICSDAGMLRVYRGAVEIVAAIDVAAGVNQFAFGDQPGQATQQYKFQLNDVTTLRKGSNIAVVQPL